MNRWLRKARGVLGMGALWGAVWGTVTALFGFGLMIFDPASIDPGEHPLQIGALLAAVGFVSGSAFAIMLSLSEHRRSLRDVSMLRNALCGMAGAAVIPLVTGVNDSMVFILCPIGAGLATASLAIARRAEMRALRGDSAEMELLGERTT